MSNNQESKPDSYANFQPFAIFMLIKCSTLARKFSASLHDAFAMDNDIVTLEQSVEQKYALCNWSRAPPPILHTLSDLLVLTSITSRKKAVSSQSQELEALEAQLKETKKREAELKEAERLRQKTSRPSSSGETSGQTTPHRRQPVAPMFDPQQSQTGTPSTTQPSPSASGFIPSGGHRWEGLQRKEPGSRA